jgi:hypothetical protein
LGELSVIGQRKGAQRFQVIACIGGRGFGVRREDMKKMLMPQGARFLLWTLCPRWWSIPASRILPQNKVLNSE